MDIKQLYNIFFKFNPENNYNFTLPENEEPHNQDKTDSNTLSLENSNVFPSLKVNLEYMKTKYNYLINNDVIFRQFTLNARGKQYDAFIVYIDGMVDSKIMDDFVLKPLLMRNTNNLFDENQNKVVSEAISNNITVRKVKKFDLSNYIMGCLMPQNSVKEAKDFNNVISGINSRKLCIICRNLAYCI